MSNDFRGDGNLGAVPVLKSVSVGGEKRSVAEFRIAFDNYTSSLDDATGETKYEEKGSFWLNATLWGPRGERAVALLTKGARVHVTGKLTLAKWTDKESGEEREALQLQADDIFISTVRVETVSFKEKAERSERAVAKAA
jgi:single-strand DNA-binding protein